MVSWGAIRNSRRVLGRQIPMWEEVSVCPGTKNQDRLGGEEWKRLVKTGQEEEVVAICQDTE